jgi:hypothetical protein
MLKKLLRYKDIISWLLICVSAPVVIGLLARWGANPGDFGFGRVLLLSLSISTLILNLLPSTKKIEPKNS